MGATLHPRDSHACDRSRPTMNDLPTAGLVGLHNASYGRIGDVSRRIPPSMAIIDLRVDRADCLVRFFKNTLRFLLLTVQGHVPGEREGRHDKNGDVGRRHGRLRDGLLRPAWPPARAPVVCVYPRRGKCVRGGRCCVGRKTWSGRQPPG